MTEMENMLIEMLRIGIKELIEEPMTLERRGLGQAMLITLDNLKKNLQDENRD